MRDLRATTVEETESTRSANRAGLLVMAVEVPRPGHWRAIGVGDGSGGLRSSCWLTHHPALRQSPVRDRI